MFNYFYYPSVATGSCFDNDTCQVGLEFVVTSVNSVATIMICPNFYENKIKTLMKRVPAC